MNFRVLHLLKITRIGRRNDHHSNLQWMLKVRLIFLTYLPVLLIFNNYPTQRKIIQTDLEWEISLLPLYDVNTSSTFFISKHVKNITVIISYLFVFPSQIKLHFQWKFSFCKPIFSLEHEGDLVITNVSQHIFCTSPSSVEEYQQKCLLTLFTNHMIGY